MSTTSQAEDGQGLQIQEQAIRSWARERRDRVVRVFRDEGISGTTDERAALTEALSTVRYGNADGLVVASLDRLARSLTIQEAALQQVWQAGGRVFAIDQGEVLADDPDDPVRTFVRQILGAVAQLEAGMIARRLRVGRRHKAAAGGYAYGAPPFGFRAEDGDLVEERDEAAAIRRIVALRREGRSLRRIAATLAEEGIRPKRGGKWHPQTVARVLDRARPNRQAD